jgi:hypothetical protein
VRGPWWASVLRGQGFPRDSTSTLADIESFLDFAERTYRDRWPDLTGLAPRLHC